VSDPLAGPRLPYPGLRPFEEEDQAVFFGREAQVSRLLQLLEDDHFVAVVGSSGCGKSSLVRAGLVPAIRGGFLFARTDWLVLLIKPGYRPHFNLVEELRRHLPDLDADKTLKVLSRADGGLLSVLREANETRPVLLVVDQFEELFAFRRESARIEQVASRDDAAAFVDMLLHSCAARDGQVWVVSTMRSDFIGNCEAFLGLPEVVSRSQFLVPRLDRRQMEQAIRRPGEPRSNPGKKSLDESKPHAESQIWAFRPFTFEAGLINQIINDAGDRPDQLPLMQHALMRTWKNAVSGSAESAAVVIESRHYAAAGGIAHALALDANSAWDKIKDDPRSAQITRRLFVLLCDVSLDEKITRRRPRISEVQDVSGATLEEVATIIARFNDDDRNFLQHDKPLTAESPIDVSHEALLRQWPLFTNQWLVVEREDAAELRRLVDQESLVPRVLLPRRGLQRVDLWQQRVTEKWSRRYVDPDTWNRVMAFVAESKAAANRASRGRRRTFAIIGAVLVILTFLSFWMMIRANQARDRALVALTTSYVRTIGLGGVQSVSADEGDALWELAQLNGESAQVRQQVLKSWFSGDQQIFRRAFANDGRGLRAAIGLDPTLRQALLDEPVEKAILGDLEEASYTDSARRQISADAAVGLIENLSQAEAEKLGNGFLAKMGEENRRLDSLTFLGKGVLAAARRVPRKKAESLSRSAAGILLATIAREESTGQLTLISDAIRVVANLSSLTGSSRAAIADSAVTAEMNLLSRVGASDFSADSFRARNDSRETLELLIPNVNAQTAQAWAKKLLAEQSAAIGSEASPKDFRLMDVDGNKVAAAKAFIGRLSQQEAGIEAETACAEAIAVSAQADLRPLFRCTSAFKLLQPAMNPADTKRLVNSVIKMAVKPKPAKTDPSRTVESLWSLLPLAAKNADGAETIALLSLMTSSLSDKRHVLSNEKRVPFNFYTGDLDDDFQGITPRQPVAAARRLAIQAKAIVEDPLVPSPNVLTVAAAGIFRIVAPSLDERTSGELADEIVQRAEKGTAAGPVTEHSLGLLAWLAPELNPKDALDLSDRIVNLIESDPIAGRFHLRLIDVLVPLAHRLQPEKIPKLSSRLVNVMNGLPRLPGVKRSHTNDSDAWFSASLLTGRSAGDEIDYGMVSSLTEALAALRNQALESERANLATPEADALVRVLQKLDCPRTQKCTAVLRLLKQVSAAVTTADGERIAGDLVGYMARLQALDHERQERLVATGSIVAELGFRSGSGNGARIAHKALQLVMEPVLKGDIQDARVLAKIGVLLAPVVIDDSRFPFTRLYALSNMFMNPIPAAPKTPDEESEENSRRNAAIKLASVLSERELIEALKWPFCVGEAQKIVLEQIESKSGGTSQPNLWDFLTQDSLRRRFDLETPPQRPKAERVMQELKAADRPRLSTSSSS
jgi:AAA ATPase domain